MYPLTRTTWHAVVYAHRDERLQERDEQLGNICEQLQRTAQSRDEAVLELREAQRDKEERLQQLEGRLRQLEEQELELAAVAAGAERSELAAMHQLQSRDEAVLELREALRDKEERLQQLEGRLQELEEQEQELAAAAAVAERSELAAMQLLQSRDEAVLDLSEALRAKEERVQQLEAVAGVAAGGGSAAAAVQRMMQGEPASPRCPGLPLKQQDVEHSRAVVLTDPLSLAAAAAGAEGQGESLLRGGPLRAAGSSGSSGGAAAAGVGVVVAQAPGPVDSLRSTSELQADLAAQDARIRSLSSELQELQAAYIKHLHSESKQGLQVGGAGVRGGGGEGGGRQVGGEGGFPGRPGHLGMHGMHKHVQTQNTLACMRRICTGMYNHSTPWYQCIIHGGGLAQARLLLT